MCISKASGGMGFRNLQAFNLAMLAKQAWHILLNPSSLVARVLRAKYFPTGDVLNAKLSNSPSYSWRSIYNSLKVLREGTRWRIGNGKRIHIWDDRWMPNPSTYKVISPPNNNPEFPMVSSLIDPITKWWKANLVRVTFLPFEAETILRIPLNHNLPEDKVIWLGNSHGEFTVKSGYHITHKLLDAGEKEECSSGDPFRLLWKKLWHLNLPANVKIFAWRACVNGLPTMENMNIRGITDSRTCPICGSEPENITHAMLKCVFSSQVWNFWTEIPSSASQNNLNFQDSAMLILTQQSPQVLETFFAVAWAIWYNRNKVVHNDGNLSPQQTWLMAKSLMEDCTYAADLELSYVRTFTTYWKPPPPGTYKINVDGASIQNKFSSMGVIVRDSKGQPIVSLCKFLQSSYTAEQVEIIALEQGILLAKELQQPKVIFESDALNVIQAINDKAIGSSTGHFIQDFIQAHDMFESCSFKHISHDLNKVAHELAQYAWSSTSSHIWRGVIPPMVTHLIQSEMCI